MRNTLLAGTLATSTLVGCADHRFQDQYSQNGFLAAAQEIIAGVPTTVEIFEAGTNNSGVKSNPGCIRNDIVKGVRDILITTPDGKKYIAGGRETADVCIIPNGDSESSIDDHKKWGKWNKPTS